MANIHLPHLHRYWMLSMPLLCIWVLAGAFVPLFDPCPFATIAADQAA